MKSDSIKKGIQRAPHRSLLRACGLDDEDFKKPFIGIANSFTDIVPGHIHLKELVEFVKEGIIAAGGVPFEFDTMAICDGISMNHEGMKYCPQIAPKHMQPMQVRGQGNCLPEWSCDLSLACAPSLPLTYCIWIFLFFPRVP